MAVEPAAHPRENFLAAESRFHGRYAGSLRDTMLQAYRPMLSRLLIAVGIGFVGRAALLGNTNLIGYWIDSLCEGASCGPQSAWLRKLGSTDFLFLLAAASTIGFVFTLIFRAAVSRISAEAVSRIYDETTMRCSRLPASFFDRNPSGRVMTRFTSDYNNIFRVFGGPAAEFVSLVLDLLAMTLLLCLASPWLLPFWLLQGLLNFLVYRAFLPALRRERREMAARRSPAIAHFAESAAGASTIRAFQREADFNLRFSRLNDSFLEQRLRSVGIFSLFSFSMGACTALAFLATGFAAFHLVRTGAMGIGAVGVAFAYLGLSSHVLQAFFDWLGQFEEALTGLERMNEYLRKELEPGARLPAQAQFHTGQPREQVAARKLHLVNAREGLGVEIRDLTLRYRPELPPVLDGVSLSISGGERIAVVGRTGSGKTSLVQALFRLYPLERGRILVGGYEAETDGAREPVLPMVDLRFYRSLLSYVTQEPTLFLGSVRDNLLAPEARGAGGSIAERDGRCISALRSVQFLAEGATDDEYSHWLDFQLQERGRNLSSGERQLLCMARCLLQNTPVVVMDEATSSVDPRSEEILTRATEEFFRGKTQIIIAHRLSTIRSCDRVLWLEAGRVRALGPPGKVLADFETAELQP